MNWPLASDYQDAVQNPAQCFGDAQLKLCRPVLTRLGLPRVASGTFASVYELCNLTAHPPQRWAVRCFSRPGTDQQNRYALLSQRLSQARIPELVGFTYHAQGIRIKGHWFPIVTMEWVEGTTLHTYIGKHLGDGDRLRGLADQWREMIAHLRARGIAHGDLQHGNVLVTNAGELRLVDYDGMYVPDLSGQPSHELGHPNYQHPQRGDADYDEDLDDFAALVIYASLVALSYDPDLWAQFHTGENLIFSAVDFKAPQKSPVFERLYHSDKPAVRELSRKLAVACEGKFCEVSDFEYVLANVTAVPVPQKWWDTGRAPASKPTLAAFTGDPLPAARSGAAHETPLPEWMQSPRQATALPVQQPDAPPVPPKTKAAQPLALFLARLWNEPQADQANQNAQDFRAAAPVPPFFAASPRSERRARPRKAWLTCTGVSCLFACITLYGLTMLAQIIMRGLQAFAYPSKPRAVTIKRPAAHPLNTSARVARPLATPPSRPGVPANGRPE